MRRYHLLIIISISGFLFVTVYLMAAILTKNEEEVTRNNRLIKAVANEGKAKDLDLSETETRRLMSERDSKPFEFQYLAKQIHMSYSTFKQYQESKDPKREVEVINNQRIQKVEEICRKYNLGLFKSSQNETLEHPPVPHYGVFFFDRENKLSLCPIYKAGSSTWLYNLLLLSGMTEKEIETSDKQLSVLVRARFPELDPIEAEEALHKTIKILTVRHPFERLLSAYRDKLENMNARREHGTLHFYKSFGSKIVKKYRETGNRTKTWNLLRTSQYLWNPEQARPAGVEPTFREFVLYLIDTNLVHYADDHWIPYYLFCTPCLLRYDIIAKVETMDLDQLYSIRVLGLQKKIKPRWRHKTQFIYDDGSDSVSHLSKIYFNQLSTDEIRKLYSKYKVDFELFGYSHVEYLKYASDYSSEKRLTVKEELQEMQGLECATNEKYKRPPLKPPDFPRGRFKS